MAITTQLTDLSLPEHILLDASASCAPTLIGHTNRWQGFLSLVLPSQPFTDFRKCPLEYPFRRGILLHLNEVICCTTSILLLDWMRKLLLFRTRPKMLRKAFLSNTLTAAASVLNRCHASAP